MSASVSTGPESSAVTGGPAPTDGAPAGAPAAVEAEVMALIQLSGLVRDTFQRVAERHDLTPVQARMLCVLAEKPRGMAELARLFGVGKANMTGLVDRAAQRDLVERSLVPNDRRAIQVVLTEDGRRSALAFHQTVIEELDHLLAPLTPQARADFRKSAGAIAETADHPGSWPRHQTC
ncbi:MarR family winged helix-turn-helix transcriptional regulator [Streptomyces acidicola]|uniref:MarR family winged helix-turn-helix transcriptional regulator n=1 Tax=Streptomyces acidicola TaxID=2596892 RepID=UPI0038259014